MKKRFSIDGLRNIDAISHNNPNSNLSLNIDDFRQRVESIRSRNKESVSIRMENIAETHENQEIDGTS